MVPLGITNVQLDLPGHGYSEGERAYATHYSHWVDDIFQVPLFLFLRLVPVARSD